MTPAIREREIWQQGQLQADCLQLSDARHTLLVVRRNLPFPVPSYRYTSPGRRPLRSCRE